MGMLIFVFNLNKKMEYKLSHTPTVVQGLDGLG